MLSMSNGRGGVRCSRPSAILWIEFVSADKHI